MSWASRRRILYGGGTALFFGVVIGIPAFFFFYEAPTCSDGKQNQGEAAIDRGGPCRLLAESQVQQEAVVWSRSFEVVPGIYNAVAYVDNPNFDAGVSGIAYSFKLFDAQNILVAERRGRTYLSPNGITPVFEGGIATGERVPTRTFFAFLEAPVWERAANDRERIVVGTRTLSNEDAAPRIDAVLRNQSFEDVSDIEIVATVFDANGNAMGSSRTAVDLLPRQEETNVVFTWPRPFAASVARIEILPRTPFSE